MEKKERETVCAKVREREGHQQGWKKGQGSR